jgi:O-antigen ligase
MGASPAAPLSDVMASVTPAASCVRGEPHPGIERLLVQATGLVLVVYLAAEMAQVGVPLRDLGIPSPWTLMTIMGTLTVLGCVVARRHRFPMSPILVALAFFIWSRALSVLDALNPKISTGPLGQLTKDALTVIVVLALGVWSARRLPKSMDLVILAVAAITALAGLQQFVVGIGNEFLGFSLVRDNVDIGASTVRFQGPTSDPNFWARVLVALLPFAVAAVAVHRGLSRLIFAGCTLSLLMGIFLTQSRAGFVAGGVTFVVVLVIAGGKARRLLMTAPVVIGLLLINPATGPRLATLVDLTKGSEEVTDLSIAYREAAQRGGLEMFRDHPMTGVGIGNFDTALLPYLRNGVAELPPTARFGEIAPHNTYLQMAAESGIVGLIGFLALFGCAVALAVIAGVRAHRMPPTDPDANRFKWFTTALIASLGGWAMMSVSLHEAQVRTLFGLFGLAGAAEVVTRTLPRGRRKARLPWAMVRGDLIRGALAVVASAVAVLLLPVQSQDWERTVTMLIEVDEPAADRFAYLQNFAVRSDNWRRTLAAVTTSDGVRAKLAGDIGEFDSKLNLRATARRFNSSIEYRFGGPNPDTVELLTNSVNLRMVEAVDELNVPFRLRPLPAGPARQITKVNPLLVAAAITLPLLLMVQSWTKLLARRRRYARTYQRVRTMLEGQRAPE